MSGRKNCIPYRHIDHRDAVIGQQGIPAHAAIFEIKAVLRPGGLGLADAAYTNQYGPIAIAAKGPAYLMVGVGMRLAHKSRAHNAYADVLVTVHAASSFKAGVFLYSGKPRRNFSPYARPLRVFSSSERPSSLGAPLNTGSSCSIVTGPA